MRVLPTIIGFIIHTFINISTATIGGLAESSQTLTATTESFRIVTINLLCIAVPFAVGMEVLL